MQWWCSRFLARNPHLYTKYQCKFIALSLYIYITLPPISLHPCKWQRLLSWLHPSGQATPGFKEVVVFIFNLLAGCDTVIWKVLTAIVMPVIMQFIFYILDVVICCGKMHTHTGRKGIFKRVAIMKWWSRKEQFLHCSQGTGKHTFHFVCVEIICSFWSAEKNLIFSGRPKTGRVFIVFVSLKEHRLLFRAVIITIATLYPPDKCRH